MAFSGSWKMAVVDGALSAGTGPCTSPTCKVAAIALFDIVVVAVAFYFLRRSSRNAVSVPEPPLDSDGELDDGDKASDVGEKLGDAEEVDESTDGKTSVTTQHDFEILAVDRGDDGVVMTHDEGANHCAVPTDNLIPRLSLREVRAAARQRIKNEVVFTHDTFQ